MYFEYDNQMIYDQQYSYNKWQIFIYIYIIFYVVNKFFLPSHYYGIAIVDSIS